MSLIKHFDLKLDPQLTEWADRVEPGCTIGILDQGDLVFAAGYGVEDLASRNPITPDTRFDIASEAKQFTAACALLLEKDGRIALDEESGRSLPELPEHFRGVTARQLLHHTSGIPDFYRPIAALGMLERACTLDDVYQFICQLPALEFQPGDRFAYSNSGYALLAMLVQRISGMTFAQFVDERIFRPLGMSDSFVHDSPGRLYSRHAKGHLYDQPSGYRECWYPQYAAPGAGCVYSSVRDLSRWLGALHGNVANDLKLIDQMLTPARLNDGSETKYGMGLDWGQCFTSPPNLRVITHSGGHGGSRAIMVHLPVCDSSIILLCNNRRIDHARIALEMAVQLVKPRRR